MKPLIIGTLSVLALMTGVFPVLARDFNSANAPVRQTNSINVTPFNLVHLGYQGYFEEQGIPSGGVFLSAVRQEAIAPRELVASAIRTGRLSPDYLNNEAYLEDVAAILLTLRRQ
ncbi:MAG: hypothetical protein HC890_01680 [Chloroflexaceae bacterium]|nr:hypothetical protein [Chloroflexaceae bacterium]